MRKIFKHSSDFFLLLWFLLQTVFSTANQLCSIFEFSSAFPPTIIINFLLISASLFFHSCFSWPNKLPQRVEGESLDLCVDGVVIDATLNEEDSKLLGNTQADKSLHPIYWPLKKRISHSLGQLIEARIQTLLTFMCVVCGNFFGLVPLAKNFNE